MADTTRQCKNYSQDGGNTSVFSGQVRFAKPKVVTADTTLTLDDSGNVVVVNAAATKIITLPAGVEGAQYTFVLQVASTSGAGHAISPAAADKIVGKGVTTPAVNKDLVNAQATAAIGDYVTLRHDGVDTWYITSQGGTWTRET